MLVRFGIFTLAGSFTLLMSSCTGVGGQAQTSGQMNQNLLATNQSSSSVSAADLITTPVVPTPTPAPVLTSGGGILYCPDGSRPNLDSNDPCPGSGLLVCKGGMTPVNNKCMCPAGAYDTGDACVTCATNQQYNPKTQECDARTSCDAGYTYDGHSCVAISENCKAYQEIVDDNFAIPARDSSNMCYYIKIVNTVASQGSMNIVPRRTDVVARNHDNWNGNQAPHLMGDRSLSFRIMGPRQVVLSGDTHGAADIYVDNFFLVEIGLPGATSPTLWASGTGDAPPIDSHGNQTPILVGGKPILDYHAYQGGGTSNFSAYDFSPLLDVGANVTFRGSALDCGGVAYSSDVYLVFK